CLVNLLLSSSQTSYGLHHIVLLTQLLIHLAIHLLTHLIVDSLSKLVGLLPSFVLGQVSYLTHSKSFLYVELNFYLYLFSFLSLPLPIPVPKSLFLWRHHITIYRPIF